MTAVVVVILTDYSILSIVSTEVGDDGVGDGDVDDGKSGVVCRSSKIDVHLNSSYV